MNNDIMTNINKYALSYENIMHIINNIQFKERKTEIKKNVEKKEKNIECDNYFFPENKYNDSLFWCWIILKFGFADYEINHNNIFSYEKNNKIQFFEKLKQIKKELKSYKIKIRDIESNLIIEDKMNLQTFHSLLILNKFNFIYIDDKFYYESINFENDKICYIIKKNNRFGIWTNNSIPDIKQLKKNLIVIDNLIKPIKAIGNYKINDIHDICKKLNIHLYKDYKKLNKKELYLLIKQNI